VAFVSRCQRLAILQTASGRTTLAAEQLRPHRQRSPSPSVTAGAAEVKLVVLVDELGRVVGVVVSVIEEPMLKSYETLVDSDTKWREEWDLIGMRLAEGGASTSRSPAIVATSRTRRLLPTPGGPTRATTEP
jgi:hypothetical protein